MKQLLFVGLVAALTACSVPAPTETLPTLVPTNAAIVDSVTPTPFVPPAPTTTLTPVPTATPSAGDVPCPLTGGFIAPEALSNRRPLLIHIGNTAGERPQYGLTQADLVFEASIGDGATTFIAAYFCTDAETIGGIRGARLITQQLAPMLDAVAVYAGGSSALLSRLGEDVYLNANQLDQARGDVGFTVRADLRQTPFNIFGATGSLRQAARQRGIRFPGSPAPLTFSEEIPPSGSAAPVVKLAYSPNYWVRWRWKPEKQVWERTLTEARSPNAGGVHLDAVTGQPLTARNVLVIWAAHTPAGFVEEEERSAEALAVELIGSGAATLFRDGQRFEAQWSRSEVTQWFTLTLADGTPLGLSAGQTYVQIFPLDATLEVSER
ncbi:MAG: DUF3048 domain-containing protein [Anaerolineales bacterium]